MSLHRSKRYGLPDPRSFLDKSRERLDDPVPHQAPQRERVTLASRPPVTASSPLRPASPADAAASSVEGAAAAGSGRTTASSIAGGPAHSSSGSAGGVSGIQVHGSASPLSRRPGSRFKKKRRWQDLISPDLNFGVPQLMMILEPNVVWDHNLSLAHPKGSNAAAAAAAARRTPPRPHSHSHSHALPSGAAAGGSVCSAGFFDGWDASGRLAHGVYEGSYWQLLGDLSQLEAMLRSMTGRAPQLLEEPELCLPDKPPPIRWQQFAPVPLQPPEAATLPQLELPEYVEPVLPTEPDMPPVVLVDIPDLGPPLQEVPLPEYKVPPPPVVEPPEEIELVLPALPQPPPAPTPPVFHKPKYGEDWEGQQPHRVALPEFVPAEIPPEPSELHLEVPEPELQQVTPEMALEPWVKLTWHAGPEEEAPQVATLQDVFETAAPPAEPSAEAAAEPAAEPAVQEPSAASAATSSAAAEDSVVAASEASSVADLHPQAEESAQSVPPAEQPLATLTKAELAEQWAEVQGSEVDAVAGQPMVWLDFKPPFAEPPPVLIPPKPDLGDEPQLVVEGLEDMPAFTTPELQEVPEFQEPPLHVPTWSPPCEPQPVGFLRGCGPLLIMDVSGTMHPARRGMLPRVKACVASLLTPNGEMATATDRFDVLAFAGVTWAWSHHAVTQRHRLASVLKGYYDQSGRQAGSAKPGGTLVKSRPGSAVGDILRNTAEGQGLAARAAARSAGLAGLAAEVGLTSRPASAGAAGSTKQRPKSAGASSQLGQTKGSNSDLVQPVAGLQPTTEENLTAAKAWVENWPDASGHTRLINALQLAHTYNWATPSWATSATSRPSSPSAAAMAAGGSDTAGTAAAAAEAGEKPDCWYLFSDGLADGAAACLEWVEEQKAAGRSCPPIHCIGFFPPNDTRGGAGERFLKQLAALTGGTFQVYDADLAMYPPTGSTLAPSSGSGPQLARVYDPDQGGFMTVDLCKETEDQRTERLWAEGQLRQLRIGNRRRGVVQSLHDMFSTLKQHHQQQRQLSVISAHQRYVAQLKEAYSAAVTAVAAANAAVRHKASVEHEAACRAVNKRNEERTRQAKLKHALALAAWRRKCEEKLAAWEDACALAQEAVEAAAQVEAAAHDSSLVAAIAASNSAAALAGGASGGSGGASPRSPRSGTRPGSGVTRTESARPRSALGPSRSAAAGGQSMAELSFAASSSGVTPRGKAVTTGSPDTPAQPKLGGDYTSWASSDGDAAGGAAAEQQSGVVGEPSLAGDSSGSSLHLPGSSADSTLAGGVNHGRPQSGLRPGSAVAGAAAGGGTARGRPTSAAPGSLVPRPSPVPPLPPLSEGSGAESAVSMQPAPRPGTARAAQQQQRMNDPASLSSGRAAAKAAGATPCGVAAAAVAAAAATSTKHISDKPRVNSAGRSTSVAAGALFAAQMLSKQQSNSDGLTRQDSGPRSLADIIAGITAANQQMLAILYERWLQQIAEADAANAAAWEQYESAAAQAAAAVAARELLRQQWVELKQKLEEAAQQAHRAALAKVDGENQRIASAHRAEIEAKLAREQEYARDVEAHKAALVAAQQHYEAAVVHAKREHAAAVAGEKARWQVRVGHAQQLWELQKEDTLYQHNRLLEEVKEKNRLLREEARVRSEAHRAAQVENKRRQQVAEEARLVAKAKLAEANKLVMEAAYQDYLALCDSLRAEHAEAVAAARAQHAAAVAAIQARNAAALEEAQAAWAAAVKAQEDEWQGQCQALREDHAAQVDAVRQHNASVWAQVQVARIAATELQRVAAFAAHIRHCAAKMSLGVNFLDGTPNLDRVVEMSALTEALQAAFPEVVTPWAYPWPGSPNIERTVDISGAAMSAQTAAAAATAAAGRPRTPGGGLEEDGGTAAAAAAGAGRDLETEEQRREAEAAAEAARELRAARGWQVRSPPPGPVYPGPVRWEDVVEEHYEALRHQESPAAGDDAVSQQGDDHRSHSAYQQQLRQESKWPMRPATAAAGMTRGRLADSLASSSGEGPVQRPQTAGPVGATSRLGRPSTACGSTGSHNQALVISAYGSVQFAGAGGSLGVQGASYGRGSGGVHLNTWHQKLQQKGVSVAKQRQQQLQLQQRMQDPTGNSLRPRSGAGQLQRQQ